MAVSIVAGSVDRVDQKQRLDGVGVVAREREREQSPHRVRNDRDRRADCSDGRRQPFDRIDVVIR